MGARRTAAGAVPALLAAAVLLLLAGCGGDGESAGTEGAGGSNGAAAAGARMTVAYAEPETEDEELIAEFLQDSGAFEAIAETVAETFVLPDDVEIVVGGGEGPYYDPESRTIVFDYAFVDLILGVFADADPGAPVDEILEAADNVSAMVLLHEIGHALVDLLDIPITGREEDSVDNLATVIVAEFVDGGGDIALDFADFWSLIAADPDQLREADFWGEHSLDLQRAFQTVCLVYGSDPRGYRDLREFMPRRRAARCPEEWDQISDAWIGLLAPHVSE